jgi:DNA polymerase-1
MVNVHQKLKKAEYGARMLLQIHDELVFEVPSSQVKEAATMIAHEMTNAIPLQGVPVTVDIGIGKNWLDLEPLDLGQSA